MDKKNWMSQLSNKLKLNQICIPGSHDAGVYYNPIMRALSTNPLLHKIFSLVYTQGLDTTGQLENGIRYFDVRPWSTSLASAADIIKWIEGKIGFSIPESLVAEVIKALNLGEGDFVAHHEVPLGMRIADMVKAANDFVASHSSEVVIFAFSHFEHFNGVDEKFIEVLLENLQPTQRLVVEYGTNITEMLLSELKGKVILLIENDSMYKNSVKGKNKKGIYLVNEAHERTVDGVSLTVEFPLYDKYANENDYQTTVANQLCKFGKFAENKLFLLNWTMTASGWALLPGKSGVEDYAEEINPRLLGCGHASDFLLQPNFYGKIVNIINGDFWEKSGDDVVKACLKVMENRDRKLKAIKLVSKADQPLKLLPISKKEGEGGCHFNADHAMYNTWYKIHIRDNVYRLRNAGSGLYLRAATDGFWASIFSSRDNNLLGSLQEDSDQNLDWHFEPLGDNTFHIVACLRKKEGIKEDRLDASHGNLYLHQPNDGEFQKWVESSPDPL